MYVAKIISPNIRMKVARGQIFLQALGHRPADHRLHPQEHQPPAVQRRMGSRLNTPRLTVISTSISTTSVRP